MTTYRTVILGGDNSQVDVNIDYTPPPKPPPFRLGVNFTPATTTTNIARYPGLAYHRVFSNTGLPPLSTGKMRDLPPGCTRHVSWKVWDEAALQTWLATLGTFLEAVGAGPIYLTYRHEPDNDTNPNDAEWRARTIRLVELTAGNPWVAGVGPIVTTSYLARGGDPRVWWVDGCGFFAADRYAHLGNPTATLWPHPNDMFYRVREAAQDLDVPWMIPEWGDAGGTATDTPRTPSPARAAWLRDCYQYLAAADNGCIAAAWWNIGHDVLTGDELATMQTLVQTQAVNR